MYVCHISSTYSVEEIHIWNVHWVCMYSTRGTISRHPTVLFPCLRMWIWMWKKKKKIKTMTQRVWTHPCKHKCRCVCKLLLSDHVPNSRKLPRRLMAQKMSLGVNELLTCIPIGIWMHRCTSFAFRFANAFGFTFACKWTGQVWCISHTVVGRTQYHRQTKYRKSTHGICNLHGYSS